MKSLLIQLDDPSYRALNRIAPPADRRRSQFIRDAIRQAIRQAEYAAMRSAYEARPDSESEADDWSTAEEFKREAIRSLAGRSARAGRKSARSAAKSR